MKNILNKIEFHYSYFIVAISFILIGYYKNLIIFTSLIIVHEFGHFLVAKLLKFNVKKIIIYPFGGITKIEDYINRKSSHELLIAISGIIFQILYYLIFVYLYKQNIFTNYTYTLFQKYHYSMLLFNLLPIIPLDGYKITNILLNKIISYKKSNIISIYISFITLIILLSIFINSINYSYILVIGVLVQNIYLFYTQLEYLFNKFLVERYLHNFSFKKTIIINNYNKMNKNCSHIIKKDNKYTKEKQFLIKMFDNNNQL